MGSTTKDVMGSTMKETMGSTMKEAMGSTMENTKVLELIDALYLPAKVRRRCTVNLDKLTQPARNLAESISNTDNNDGFSKVMMISPLTNKETSILLGLDEMYDPSDPFYIHHENKTYDYDPRDADCLHSYIWHFGALRSSESPEAYLERQIKQMKANYFTEFVSSYLLLLDGLTSKHVECRFSLYEDPADAENVAILLKERLKRIGSITRKMKAVGASIEQRSLFVDYAMEHLPSASKHIGEEYWEFLEKRIAMQSFFKESSKR